MITSADQALVRARAAVALPIKYKLGAGGRVPDAVTPANAAGECDCSGLTAWCFGIARETKDPFYLQINGGWINTDAMVADARDPRGLFDAVPRDDAQPGDLFVFGKGAGRRYGHVGVISKVVTGVITKVIHCSAANRPTAVQETDPAVFVRHGAVVIRRAFSRSLPVLAPGAAWRGRMSTFGGPADLGVSPSEGLALWGPEDERHPRLASILLRQQPPGTTGLARRLNPDAHYVACRWDYRVTPRNHLRTVFATVTNLRTGKSMQAIPTDWGPAARTGRVADLAPGLARALGLQTDDECLVTVPVPGGR